MKKNFLEFVLQKRREGEGRQKGGEGKEREFHRGEMKILLGPLYSSLYDIKPQRSTRMHSLQTFSPHILFIESNLISIIYCIVCRRSLKDIDPFLLAPTSLFLASKVEEHGMMSHNKLIQATNNACEFLH